MLRVPTIDEALRIRAFLIVRRNQTKDYLDLVALTVTMGDVAAAGVLSTLDGCYADQRGDGMGVASQVARQLSDPRPADQRVTQELNRYKGLDSRWHRWQDLTQACHRLADLMVQGDPG